MVGVSPLRITDVLAIDPDVGGTIDAPEHDKHTIVVPLGWQLECADIRPDRIDAIARVTRPALNVGRSIGMRILDVAIYRFVIALHLPVGRHLDVIPS